jgi:hypothetical protein
MDVPGRRGVEPGEWLGRPFDAAEVLRELFGKALKGCYDRDAWI